MRFLGPERSSVGSASAESISEEPLFPLCLSAGEKGDNYLLIITPRAVISRRCLSRGIITSQPCGAELRAEAEEEAWGPGAASR